MKISVEHQVIVLEEIFSGVMMRTPDGHELGICMRDGTFEIGVFPKGENSDTWWRVDMEKGRFEKLPYPINYGSVQAPDSFTNFSSDLTIDDLTKDEIERP